MHTVYLAAILCWTPKGLSGFVTPCEPVRLGWPVCRGKREERVLGCHLRVWGACPAVPTTVLRPQQLHPHSEPLELEEVLQDSQHSS